MEKIPLIIKTSSRNSQVTELCFYQHNSFRWDLAHTHGEENKHYLYLCGFFLNDSKVEFGVWINISSSHFDLKCISSALDGGQSWRRLKPGGLAAQRGRIVLHVALGSLESIDWLLELTTSWKKSQNIKSLEVARAFQVSYAWKQLFSSWSHFPRSHQVSTITYTAHVCFLAK